jgi:hypothetical protein
VRLLHRDPAAYWVPIGSAARLVGRTHRTVRRWCDDGEVRARCDLPTRQVKVWLLDVFDADERHERRTHRKAC